jgi:serine/threonine protein kinase
MSADWEALRELFDGALERPVDERAAYLNERTQGNDALRREIESLLAAHGAADQFLSAPALRPSSTPSFPSVFQTVAIHSGASTRLTAGTQLGAFEILALLGTGGMGEVYRARDPRLDRFVAIKILSTDIDMARLHLALEGVRCAPRLCCRAIIGAGPGRPQEFHPAASRIAYNEPMRLAIREVKADAHAASLTHRRSRTSSGWQVG